MTILHSQRGGMAWMRFGTDSYFFIVSENILDD